MAPLAVTVSFYHLHPSNNYHTASLLFVFLTLVLCEILVLNIGKFDMIHVHLSQCKHYTGSENSFSQDYSYLDLHTNQATVTLRVVKMLSAPVKTRLNTMQANVTLVFSPH